MCRTRRDTRVSDPKPRTPTARSSSNTPSALARRYSTTDSVSFPNDPTSSSSKGFSSSSSAASLSGLRLSVTLTDNPTLYPFKEISTSTKNFLSKRLSSSSSSWRCNLRGKDVVIFQRTFHGDPESLPSRLSALCKSHHSSLIKLLGASLSGGYIYLVYEYTAGATLRECLRNPINPNFTALSKWISRMQVATDLADGLEYVHLHCKTIHNRIKTSGVIVTEPNFNAKICHFGATELAGEIPEEEENIAKEKDGEDSDEISSQIISAAASPKVRRSDSRRMRIDGTRGYIAPEVITGGRISQKSDVFAFGIVILELISGREPLKYTMNRESNDYVKISLIETARNAIGTEEEDGASEIEAEERRGRIRRWVDRRLRDSFPVEVVEDLIRVALRCVEAEKFMRPEMTWVAGRVSKLFLDSKFWDERVGLPTDFSVTLAPR